MATPLPPPSPRHLRLLRLLLSGLVLGAALRGAAAGHPDVAACPGSLDCALKRRAKCPPGAHACGPCLQPFQEDQQGLCVPRMRRPPGGGQPQPRLEDEIDFLAQELARKESGHSTPPLPKARQRLLEPATLGFSARGQGLELGLPSTPGTPTPTPHTSLGSPVSSDPVHMSPLEPRGGQGDGLALVLILAFCVAGAAALSVASLCWCSLGTSGWHTARRCTTTSTNGSRCCAWSGIKSHPRSWTRPPRMRRMRTETSRCTSARAWPRPGKWRCATLCSTTPHCPRPCRPPAHRLHCHDLEADRRPPAPRPRGPRGGAGPGASH
ncbi:neural proliferation differentiation and control protein 1 isoform X4 [Gorilla gorilla gorilla]|uniref:neural proliferation differentiation and control protein 1 isoform X4 n=1 Tax=Gorilla gorilla gorilla TaxID=9595 RepID=UPI0024462A67|nr:neural proliferation differentiation and control protein 1 isoform X4 [Gorilla gorilla gorilla]